MYEKPGRAAAGGTSTLILRLTILNADKKTIPENIMKRLWLILPALLLLLIGGNPASGSSFHRMGGDENVAKKKGAWLGVKLTSVVEITDGKKATDEVKGAVVEDVVDDSPADSAGIKKGDVIIACNNIEIEDPEDLVDAMRESKPGDMANITVLRDGAQKSIAVRLGEAKAKVLAMKKTIRMPRAPRSPKAPRAIRVPRAAQMVWKERGAYGFTLKTLDEQLGTYFGAPEGKGVLIEKIRKDSDAEKAGFKAGDVIIKAGKKTVEEVADFKHVLAAYDAGETIPVQILRKEKKMSIDLKAREVDEEKHMIMRHFGDGGDAEFEFFGDDEEIVELEGLEGLKGLAGLRGLEALEEMDFDIDVDVDELEDGVRQLRIMINGEEMELDGLQEELRETMEELHEKIRMDLETDDEGEVRVEVRKI
jgi:hypothetical protein